MVSLQRGTHELYRGLPKDYIERLVLIKPDSVSNEKDKLNERVTSLEKEMELWQNAFIQAIFSIDERQKRTKVKRENNLVINNSIYDCKKVVDRTLEILAEWSEAQDLRLQIQYAAVITGKIDNIKKMDYIQSNDIRKKICTLLRNVIRINVTEDVFSKEQISLLKKGFKLLLSEQIQKKDMLQLNREFLAQKLSTMPAWE